ncbi:NAD(P)/FAD-dependent oxidoreductase [Streptomyces sp. NPDC002738]
MTELPESVVVVGGGLAGFSAARTLRESGYDGRLTLVDPSRLPYDRPPLSKGFLLGETQQEDLLLAPAHWYDDHRVDVVAGTVTRLDAAAGRVVLASGRELSADRVLLTTGSRARELPVPGGDLPGIHRLRSLSDAERLSECLAPGRHLAIIGAGLIGAEVASSARRLGVDVTLVDPVPVPLVRAVGHDLAVRLHQMHEAAGVRTVTGQVAAIRQAAGHYTITLSTGDELTADNVLAAVGGLPEADLARTAGLDTDDGILVDAWQQTSNPAVYAAGDSARLRTADGMLARRAEHWEAARQSGERAAAAMLGKDLGTIISSWFWTDRHGVHAEAFGDLASGEGRIVLRGHQGDACFAAFHVREDGTLLGAAALNDPQTVRAARKIHERNKQVDPALLADPATNLRRLAR